MLHFLLHSLPDESTEKHETKKYYTFVYHHINFITELLRVKPHAFLHFCFNIIDFLHVCLQ